VDDTGAQNFLLLYYITDRTQFLGNESAQRGQLLDKISEATRCGVDFIQLREKDLTIRGLEKLAREAVARLKTENRELRTKLLINSRTDVALAVGADGVHLRSDDVSPGVVRSLWSRGAESLVRVAVSCHSEQEVIKAAAEKADFAVFAPVFEKKEATPAGLAALSHACQHKIPVLALGGITLENARACLDSGAAGIAAIRLFQENDLSQLIPKLRSFKESPIA
jgi:thiamine-phosphate pyrophosphorylase